MADQEEQQQQGPSGVRTENEIVGGTSLYIGNLPYSLRWQGLKDLFKQAGKITFILLNDFNIYINIYNCN